MKNVINKIILILFIFSITLCGLANNVQAATNSSSTSTSQSITNGSSTGTAQTDINIDKSRIYGNDRIQTSIKISQNGWADGTDTAVIAQSYVYADALCAGPLAKKYNAPILLSNKDILSSDVINELKRLKVKKVFIVGGTGVLAQNIEKQISDIGIKDLQRLAGKDRYETSLKVAEALGSVDGIVIASGNGYADSLSIAPIAAQKGMPILLSDKDKLTADVQSYIKKANAKKCYIIGGIGAISDNIKNSISNSERLGGKDRFETNLLVIQNFQNDVNFENIFIAEGDGPTGTEFADALSGAALAAQKSAPIVLTYKNMTTDTAMFIKSKMSEKTKLIALGGASVVPDDILNGLVDLFNGKTPTSGIGNIVSPAAATAANTAQKTDGKTFTMTFTKNNGGSTIKTLTMTIDKDKTNENAMEYLKSVAKVTQLQGPGFINGIDGLVNVFLKDLPISDRQKGYYGIDWFIKLNGTLTDVGATGVYPKAGDTLNFDYHEWDWHALVAPGETVMPLELKGIKDGDTVNVGQSIKIQAVCVYRGVYDAAVKIDGTKVASTDIDGYATITMNNSGEHKISIEKETGSAEVKVKVAGGGGPGPGPVTKTLVQINGNPNLTITETDSKVINIKSGSNNNADYISITLYDENGNLAYMNQAANGQLNYNTFLKPGKYHGFIKSSSTNIVSISEFQVD